MNPAIVSAILFYNWNEREKKKRKQKANDELPYLDKSLYEKEMYK